MAVVTAVLLAVGVVMPAETARDPIGMGRMLGLAEMGQIKVALAAEAALEIAQDESMLLADRAARSVSSGGTAGDLRTPLADGWRDSVTFTLDPGGKIELKLVMQDGERAFFAWQTDGPEVYYNTHGEPANADRGFAAHNYDRGTAPSAQGALTAVYEGIHGWLWRNRGDSAVTITLRTRGEYLELREIP